MDRTQVPFTREFPNAIDVTVDAYGDIEIGAQGGYYGEMEYRTFDIALLREIAAFAEQHRIAHQAYVDGGYENPNDYWQFYPEEENEPHGGF